ncbi:CHAT domain-containing protein [Saprospira grandis]|uniref:CHAT domain-containing protein n=1 Tax=Saprospira grandis TaxID=1008 RepID=UPI0022DE6830|nr:CHAT domain-containing protein [Saprospira grandis]WBM74218.1 CHAT domain-containing protein [Saprospira grandis]
MNERPVILLNFANQQDAHLDLLKEESSRLNDILSIAHDQGSIELYREENVNVDQLIKALNRFKERIIVFHYAGHADGNSLHFDGDTAEAVGLAELLGQLPNLKFVFLNGCSTQAQVDYLLEKGVKAVIATSVAIADDKALLFSETFYRALANRSTIDSAFQFAVGALRTHFGNSFTARIFIQGEEFDRSAAMPWGLFLNKEARAVLDWSLPTSVTEIDNIKPPANPDYTVNTYMLDVFDEMCHYDPKLKPLAEDSFSGELDERLALALIIEHFPWPIGVQVRLLLSKESAIDELSMERLEQLLSTYVYTTQFLYYIALSQLWDEKRKSNISVRPYLMDLLHHDARTYQHFDYLKHFISIVQLLQKENKALFVEEFAEMQQAFEDKNEFYDAYLYLESLRAKIRQQTPEQLAAELPQLCADGEYFLSAILIKSAFLVNYDLLTIRDIRVISYRYQDPKFDHYIARLNAKVNDLAVSKALQARSYKDYANNASVILSRNMQDPKDFLNLSPFIIDKNAFGEGMTEDRATEQQLFTYAYREGEEFRYFSTIYSIYRVHERPKDQLTTASEQPRAARGGRDRRRRSSRNRRRNEEEPQSPLDILKELFSLFEEDLSR